MVQNVLNSLKSQIDRTQAVIHVPETLPAARGYSPWVELVWVNYITNALKYGGKPPVIEIVIEQHDNTVRYQVRDNGTGLTPAQQAAVFEPFTRFHNQADGHGIGLSIVRRIMEKLGGDAGVESETGNGSQFYFTLPAV
jgi:two-component system, sensor histidine kinase and response regulator